MDFVRRGDSGEQSGDVAEFALRCGKAGNLVTAVCSSRHALELVGWRVDPGGAISRTIGSGAQGDTGSSIDIAEGRYWVTAFRAADGRLKLISWDVAGNAIRRLRDSAAQAGGAGFVRIAAVHAHLFVTACRTTEGRLKLITWKLGDDGTLTRVTDSGDAAGPIEDVALHVRRDGSILTAVRTFPERRLKLIVWTIGTNGALTRRADSGDQAGEAILIALAETSVGAVVTSVRTSEGDLKLISWTVSPAAVRRTGESGPHAAGEIRGNALAPHGRDRLISAVITDEGTLKLIGWGLDPSGALQRLGDSAALGGRASLVEACETPGGDLVTAVRTRDGHLQLTAWQARSPTAPKRRVMLLDLDGVRWDVFYEHLKRVKESGATTLGSTYPFTAPPEAADTVVKRSALLRSGLGFLCFGQGSGCVHVRFARSCYPSYTLPAHATMYTGVWPNRHGISAHTFVARDTEGWKAHAWDGAPRYTALAGYCTGASSDEGVACDFAWGGLDDLSSAACGRFHRGLVSDLRAENVCDVLHRLGKRTTCVQTHIHGAAEPWTDAGRDAWWHANQDEMRSLVDACSDEDPQQGETYDAGAFVKTALAWKFLPHTVDVTADADTYSELANAKDGTHAAWDRLLGANPRDGGAPDLVATYLYSVDVGSHEGGTAYQRAYLAWFDHRLAQLLSELSPEDLDATVFVVVADHGHFDVEAPPSSGPKPTDAVFAELGKLLGIEPGLFARVAIERDFVVSNESSNLYVWSRNPDPARLVDVARSLLTAPMSTPPIGALVRVGSEYQFLAPWDPAPVALDSSRCREVLAGALDLPEASGLEAELDRVGLDAAWAQRERDLRRRLADDPMRVLNVLARVRGLGPSQGNPALRSADIVLLAPRGHAFKNGAKSTHGALGYAATRIPFVVCGRPIEGRSEIPEADLVDVTPTVLSLLGVDVSDLRLDGRPLVDSRGRPLAAPAARLPSQPAPVVRTPPLPSAEPAPRVLARLDVRAVTPISAAKEGEVAALPAAATLRISVQPGVTPRVRDAGLVLVESDAAVLRAFADEASRTAWIVNGASAGSGREIRIPLAGTEREPGSALRVEARVGGAVRPMTLPAKLAIRHLVLEVPRVPRWLERMFEAARRETTSPLPSRTGLDGEPSDAVFLGADDLVRVVSRVLARVDGAEIVDARGKLRRALRRHPSDAVAAAWSALARTARAPAFDPVAYDRAVTAFARSGDAVPALGAELATIAEQVRLHPGRLPSMATDAERVQVCAATLKRLASARQILSWARVEAIHA